MNGEEQGRTLLKQALILSQEMISDDDMDKSLQSRFGEVVRTTFDHMVDELARVVQRHVDEAVEHIVEYQLGELRASVIRSLESEYTLFKK